MSRKEHEDKNIYLEADSVEVGGLGVCGVGGHEPVPHVAVGRLPVHVVGAAEHAEGLHQSEISIIKIALTNQRPVLRPNDQYLRPCELLLLGAEVAVDCELSLVDSLGHEAPGRRVGHVQT